MKYITICFFLLFSVDLTAQTNENFWSYWGDSKAEISSYKLTLPRYGELREAKSVMIFVTEDLMPQDQVKANSISKDNVAVMKLNHIRDFKTGVYDYHTMMSVFSPIKPWSFEGISKKELLPIKLSLTVSEWCGNYFSQLNTLRDGYDFKRFSYFGKEADRKYKITNKENSFLEDDLFIRVRELVSKFKEGEYVMLTSLFNARLNHQIPMWVRAVVKKDKISSGIKVAGKTYPAIKYTVSSGVRTYQIYVEDQKERKILLWKLFHKDKGKDLEEKGELVKTQRVEYWNQNRVSDSIEIW